MLLLLQSMTEEDQRWLPRAPLNMEYDSNRTKESTAIALTWSSNITLAPLHIHIHIHRHRHRHRHRHIHLEI